MSNQTSQKINTPEGTKQTTNLPEFFNHKVTPSVLSSVIVTLQKNQRGRTAHTRSRGEVRGGGHKPWRQKGTGRARHGSIRSPIWRGGGVTHGPRNEKKFEGKINQKVRRQALAMALSLKKTADEVAIVESFTLTSFRTKEASALLKKTLGTTRNLLIVDVRPSENLTRGVSNLSKVAVVRAEDITPLEVLSYRTVVLTQDALNYLSKRLS